MSELQPGMLALVIGCTKDPVLVGCIVDIVEAIENRYPLPDKQYVWDMKGYSLGDWIISSGMGEFVVSSTHLMPIKPEADPLDQKQQQELHA